VSDLKDKSWLELCEAASREQDPEKLLELITALNDALEQREREEKARRTVARLREWPLATCPARTIAA
jgi:DNA polymerase II large subunit